MDETRSARLRARNGHQKYSAGRHKAKPGSTEWAKKRVRSIQRILSRGGDIPANVRNDMERELAAHNATIADKGFQRRRSAMISKYHMVRFFERKKASRLVKQLERKLDEVTDDVDEAARRKLQAQLHIARVDEAYTIHHPHAETYISLYGKVGKTADDQDEMQDDDQDGSKAKAALAAERPPMWKVVEGIMEQGPEALRQLRERHSADGNDVDDRADRGGQRRRHHHTRQPALQKEVAKEGKEDRRAKGDEKQGSQSQSQSQQRNNDAQQSGAESGQLNRRERRRLMREAAAGSTEKADGGDFFDI